MSAMPTTDTSAGRCLQCGYSLQGLREHRCPECGRPFNPADPATYDQPKPPPAWLGPVGACVVFIAAPVSAFLTIESGHDLFFWYLGRLGGVRGLYGLRFIVGQAQGAYVVASLLALACTAGMMMVRGTSYALPVRCVTWAAVTWWAGWLIAIGFGWLVIYL